MLRFFRGPDLVALQKVWAILGSMAIAGMAYAAGGAVPVDADDIEKLTREAKQNEQLKKYGIETKSRQTQFFV